MKRINEVLRWIAVLPAAVGAGFIVHFAAVLWGHLMLLFKDNDAIITDGNGNNPIKTIIIKCVIQFLTGAAIVYVGAMVAPRYKTIAGWLLMSASVIFIGVGAAIFWDQIDKWTLGYVAVSFVGMVVSISVVSQIQKEKPYEKKEGH